MNLDRLLVKAKRVDYNEWIKGYLIELGSTWYIANGMYEEQNETCMDNDEWVCVGLHRVHHDTICQCSGRNIRDWSKLVVEEILLYEGDRIGCCGVEYVVIWDTEDDSWYLKSDNSGNVMYELLSNICIDGNITTYIGNIHDSKGE